ncbi:MAG: hypothetical protein AABX93_01365 [Nanoarchaeota archaeon]
MKTDSKSKRGKLARASGARFELKVRADLEKDGWVVTKWMNNIDSGKIIPAKRKFNPFSKVLTIGTGFPDFVAFKKDGEKYEVIGVEVKTNGYLDKEEKEKCKFLLDNKIFSKILIVKKSKNGREIIYDNFAEKYG